MGIFKIPHSFRQKQRIIFMIVILICLLLPLYKEHSKPLNDRYDIYVSRSKSVESDAGSGNIENHGYYEYYEEKDEHSKENSMLPESRLKFEEEKDDHSKENSMLPESHLEFEEEDDDEKVRLESFPEFEEKEDDAKIRLERRKKRVRERCHSLDFQSCHFQSVVRYRYLFFHRYDTAVCTIAKAGSSTWRAHIRRVNHGPPFNVSIFEDDIRKSFVNRPIENVIRDIHAHNRIITVRHPLTRLVSAYRNKYKGGKIMSRNRPEFEKNKRKRIAGSYWDDRFHQFWLPALFANGKVPPNTHQKVGLEKPISQSVRYPVRVYEKLHRLLKPRLTFSEFLRYVVRTYQNNTADAHWKQYHATCCPCTLDYQYITKIETLSEDLVFVFQDLGIPANPDTAMNTLRKKPNIYSDFKYYRKVPVSLKREVYKYIKVDMELFGYELPKFFFEERKEQG